MFVTSSSIKIVEYKETNCFHI